MAVIGSDAEERSGEVVSAAKTASTRVGTRNSSFSTISSKGQVTLPAQVRERLGVRARDQVEFFFDGERTVVRPVRKNSNPFEKWVGIAKGSFKDEKELLAWERELRGYDEDER